MIEIEIPKDNDFIRGLMSKIEEGEEALLSSEGRVVAKLQPVPQPHAYPTPKKFKAQQVDLGGEILADRDEIYNERNLDSVCH